MAGHAATRLVNLYVARMSRRERKRFRALPVDEQVAQARQVLREELEILDGMVREMSVSVDGGGPSDGR